MALSKRALVKDINSVVDHSRNQVKLHRQEIENQENFINNIYTLVQNEAPEFADKMKEIKMQFLKLLSHEKSLADAEERYSDDLNDLSARFEVIYRISLELEVAKKKLKDSRLKIDKLRKDLEIDSLKGGQKKDKIEAELAKAIDAKKEAIQELESKYVEFINQRERFSTFKINRLQHAFQSLGTIITTAMDDYSHDSEAFQNMIKETRDQIDELLEVEPPQPEIEEDGVIEMSATEMKIDSKAEEQNQENLGSQKVFDGVDSEETEKQEKPKVLLPFSDIEFIKPSVKKQPKKKVKKSFDEIDLNESSIKNPEKQEDQKPFSEKEFEEPVKKPDSKKSSKKNVIKLFSEIEFEEPINETAGENKEVRPLNEVESKEPANETVEEKKDEKPLNEPLNEVESKEPANEKQDENKVEKTFNEVEFEEPPNETVDEKKDEKHFTEVEFDDPDNEIVEEKKNETFFNEVEFNEMAEVKKVEIPFNEVEFEDPPDEPVEKEKKPDSVESAFEGLD